MKSTYSTVNFPTPFIPNAFSFKTGKKKKKVGEENSKTKDGDHKKKRKRETKGWAKDVMLQKGTE